MSEEILIRRLNEDDLEMYRTFRLRGLREHPDAFTSSFEEESQAPPETMRTRLTSDPARPHDFTLGAFRDGKLVGAVAMVVMPREKERHKAHVFGMYVAKEAAGQGVGHALLEELIARARAVPQVRQLQLTVSSTNRRAIELYERMGFVAFGREPKAMRQGEEYLDKTHMVMML